MIKVLLADDHILVRDALCYLLEAQGDIKVVATASDGVEAVEQVKSHCPDIAVLDISMPRMDGIDFLGRLMRLRPMPVVMISTLTERGAEVTMKALELGAIDFVAKPRVGLASGLNDLAAQIVDKIRVAAVAQVRRAPVRDAAPAGGGAHMRLHLPLPCWAACQPKN